MSDCETIRGLIDRWVDGELDPADNEAVRLHVSDCSACNEMCRQLEKLQLLLRNELASEATPIDFMSFWRDLQQRINQKRGWRADLIHRVRGHITAPKLAWAVPVTIVLVLAALSLNSYLSGWRLGGARNNYASVESIDGYGRDVALLREDDSKTTVIWLYQNPEGENEAAEETSNSGPAF